MPRLETLLVDTDNGPVRINKRDFNEDKHKLHKMTKAEEKAIAATPVAPVEPATPVAPVNPVAADTGAPVPMAVVTEGKGKAARAFVVTPSGEHVEAAGIDKDGYASETDAWNAIIAAQTPAAS